MTWSTLKYHEGLDFSSFVCDEPVLNDYLHRKAVREHQNDVCVLYFLINKLGQVGGYYTINNGSIRRDDMPTAKARRNLPGYPLGTVHIGRLARHKDYVGQQLGDRLMLSAFEVAASISQASGAHALTVDAKSIVAERLYLKYGFKSLRLNQADEASYPRAMYIKMAEVRYVLQSPRL